MTDGRSSAYLGRLPFFYGWVIVGVAFVTMAIGVNARTAFSLLLPPILDEFGWDRGLAAGAFSFGFLVSAVLSPVVGALMDRRGPRFVIEIGVLLQQLGQRRHLSDSMQVRRVPREPGTVVVLALWSSGTKP